MSSCNIPSITVASDNGNGYIEGEASIRTITKDKIYTLQIILTNQCNLHCKYCYVRRDNIRSIPISIAQNAISNMIDEHPPTEWMYELSFMGGEPLVEFEKIQSISEWVWATYPDIDIHISAPTNGTLLDDSVCAWLEKNYMRFSLGLSYDGEYSQDDNRSNSTGLINAEYFRKLWPDKAFKMTISEGNVRCLAQNITELQEQGFRLAANVACGEPEWATESVAEFGRQMLILAQYYVDHPEIEPIDLLDVSLCQVFSYRDPMIRRCGIGFNYDTIDTDGERYPCHLFSSLALNEQETSVANKYLMGKRNDFTIDSCQECVLNPVCPRCYGMAYLRTGDPFSVDINLCRLFKQQVKGACSYHLKRMARLESMSEEDHLVICAIKLVLRNLHFE